MHPTAGDDKPNEEKRITHDPRLNVKTKKNQDVNVHCNENKTLSISGKRDFLLTLYFFFVSSFRTSCVPFVVVCHFIT